MSDFRLSSLILSLSSVIDILPLSVFLIKIENGCLPLLFVSIVSFPFLLLDVVKSSLSLTLDVDDSGRRGGLEAIENIAENWLFAGFLCNQKMILKLKVKAIPFHFSNKKS